MAAEATFTLKAVDSTKQAFASVQNSLGKIQSTAKSIGHDIKSYLGFKVLGEAAMMLNRGLEAAEKNATKLGLSSEELDKLTIVTGGIDSAVLAVQEKLAKTAIIGVSAFTGSDNAAKAAAIRFARVTEELKPLNEEFGNLERQIADVGKTESQLNNESLTRIETIKQEAAALKNTDPLKSRQKEIEAEKLLYDVTKSNYTLDEQIKKAKEDYAVAAEKGWTSESNALTKLNNLRTDEYRLWQQTNSIDKSVQLKAYQDLVPVIGKIKTLQDEIYKVGYDAGQIIASSFEDAILSGNKLSEVLRSLAQDILKLVFQNVITKPLAGFLGNAINSVLFRAEGGSVSTGAPYIVGERGPELFVPNNGGNIVPNNKLNGSSGMGININYNIAAGVSRADLAPILEAERKRLKAEIPDMVRRGGAYRAAFA